MCLKSADDLTCFRSLQLFFLGLTTIFCVLGHPVIAVDPEAKNLAYLYKSLGRYYCTAFMYLLYFAYFMAYIFYLFGMEFIFTALQKKPQNVTLLLNSVR